MVQLEMEMAVIGTINELLIQGIKDDQEMDDERLSMNEDIVFKYSRMIEARSGYAVVNGFSGISLNRFFSDCDQLFQYDPCRSAQEGKPSYRLRIEELLPHSAFWEGSLHGLGRPQIDILVGRMMDILDPSVNYPFDFLEDMQLLEVLMNDGEDVHELVME